MINDVFFSELYDSFSKNFPDQMLSNAMVTYPNNICIIFEIELWKYVELSIVYSRSLECKKYILRNLKGAVSFLQFLKTNSI